MSQGNCEMKLFPSIVNRIWRYRSLTFLMRTFSPLILIEYGVMTDGR
jgi:hypothetical protein